MGQNVQPAKLKWRLLLTALIIAIPSGLAIYSLFPNKQSLLDSKIFEWPFLAFILLISVVVLFYESLSSVLSRGELTIAWSKDQSVRVSNLSAAISGELDPIREDINALKKAVEEIKNGARHRAGTGRGRPLLGDVTQHLVADSNDGGAGENIQDDAAVLAIDNLVAGNVSASGVEKARIEKLRDALSNPDYKWRTVDRLATILGIAQDDVVKLVMTQNDVRLSRSISGNQIAGLTARVGRA
jgi:hypothetical protein